MSKSTALVIFIAASTAMASGLIKSSNPPPAPPAADATASTATDTAQKPLPPPPPTPELITTERAFGVLFDDPPPAPKPAPAAATGATTDIKNNAVVTIHSDGTTTSEPAPAAKPAPPPPAQPLRTSDVEDLVGSRIAIREIRDVKGFVMTVNSFSHDETTSQYIQKFPVSENCSEAQLKYTRASSEIMRTDNDSRGETAFYGCQRITSVRLDSAGDGTALIMLGGRFRALSREQAPDDNGNLAPIDMVTGGGASLANCITRGSGDAFVDSHVKYVADGREYHLTGKVLDCTLDGNGTGEIIFNILE